MPVCFTCVSVRLFTRMSARVFTRLYASVLNRLQACVFYLCVSPFVYSCMFTGVPHSQVISKQSIFHFKDIWKVIDEKQEEGTT